MNVMILVKNEGWKQLETLFASDFEHDIIVIVYGLLQLGLDCDAMLFMELWN